MITKRKRIKVLKKDLATFIMNNNVINKNIYRDIIIINNFNNFRIIIFIIEKSKYKFMLRFN